VRVIAAVARITIFGQPNSTSNRHRVASMTIKSVVRSCQREPGLTVVIELPEGPTVRVMTARAFRPQTALMKLIPVALFARKRCVLEFLRCVTFLARDGGMLTD